MQTAFRSEERFTQAEFSEWLRGRPASDVGRYELIGDRIVMSPQAGERHGGLGSALNHFLQSHVRPRALGRVFDSSAGYELPSGDTLEPDVSFIAAAQLASRPPGTRSGFIRIVPNLVIEILSGSTARRDRTEKKEIYARNGVDEYWIVDPDRRAIEVLHREAYALFPAEAITHGRIVSRVLPDLELSVEEVFADLE